MATEDLVRVINKAIRDDPKRAEHYSTGRVGFFVVGDQYYPWRDYAKIPDKSKAIAVHSHSGVDSAEYVERTGKREAFQPLNAADIYQWLKPASRGMQGKTQAIILSDGRLETLSISDKTDPRVFKLSRKQIEKELHRPYDERAKYYEQHKGDSDWDTYKQDRELLRQFAKKYGIDYREKLQWEGLPAFRGVKGTVESKPTPEAKEPWKMTKNQYRQFQVPPTEVAKLRKDTPDWGKESDYAVWDKWHRDNVKQALSEGKPVPAEVLKDYPELGKKEPQTISVGRGWLSEAKPTPKVYSPSQTARVLGKYWDRLNEAERGQLLKSARRPEDLKGKSWQQLSGDVQDGLLFSAPSVPTMIKAIQVAKAKKPEPKAEGKGKVRTHVPVVGLKVRDREGDEWVVTDRFTKPFHGFKVFSKEKNLELRALDWDWGDYTVIGRVSKPKIESKPEPKPKKEIVALKAKPSVKQSDRAIAIDRALLAKQVVSVDDPRWLKRPNRFDVRGVDTPGSGRVVSRTGFTDKGKTRMSRKHHRGWKRIKL